jgi:hypothetical protein
VSDIALELVDSLKVLDPNGRLEKQTYVVTAGTAVECHQLFDHTGGFGYSMPLATNKAFVVGAPRNFRKAMAPSRLAGAATGAAS